jgi:hypothetical protein
MGDKEEKVVREELGVLEDQEPTALVIRAA